MTYSKQDYPSEYHECVTLTQYLDLLLAQKKIVCFSHIDQAKLIKNFATQMRRKQEGVRPGVPDYIVVTPLEVFFLEMKRVKGGVVSEYQKHWIDSLNKAGTPAFICKGFDEAKKVIDTFIT